MRTLLMTLILAVSSFSLSVSAHAVNLFIVDQDGKPVKDAFVAIPEGSISEVNQAPAIMDQVDVAFVPHVLAIEKGRDVVFPNSDNIRHHVYSFSEPKRFEIKLYKGVPEQPISFSQPGLVALGCNIHDSMLGYIYVSPWPEFTVTKASGLAELSSTSNPVKTIAVWHPWLPDLTQPLMIDLETLDTPKPHTITLNLNKPKPVKRYKKYKKRYD